VNGELSKFHRVARLAVLSRLNLELGIECPDKNHAHRCRTRGWLYMASLHRPELADRLSLLFASQHRNPALLPFLKKLAQ